MTSDENDAAMNVELQDAAHGFRVALEAVPTLSDHERRAIYDLATTLTLDVQKATQRHLRNGLQIAGVI